MNPETLLDYFVLFIILIKLIFSFTYFSHLFLTYIDVRKFGKIDKIEKIDKELLLWKERTEFIFSICMSFLLIYHFHPKFSSLPIRKETKILFLFFGFILLFSAKWTIFFDEDSLFIQIINKIK
jgi:hypothetical protein